MTIRKFRPEDAPSCAQLIELNKDHLSDLYSAQELIAASAHNQYWVARDGDKVVGMIGLTDLRNGIGMLGTLCVDPNHQRGGVGRKLLQSAKQAACDQKFRKLLLLTHQQNKPMMILAIKEDFVPEGSLRDHFRDGQKHLTYFSYFFD